MFAFSRRNSFEGSNGNGPKLVKIKEKKERREKEVNLDCVFDITTREGYKANMKYLNGVRILT